MASYSLHTLTGVLGPAKKVTAMSGIGRPVRQFQGREITVEMDDNTLLLLDFGANSFAMVGGHFAERGQVVGWGFMGIYGSEGAFEVTKSVGNTAFPGHIVINPPALAKKLNLEGTPNLDQSAPFLTESHAGIQESHLWVDIRHLVDCILSGTVPVPSGDHARHVTEIIEKGYLAAQSGQTQELVTTF
jgi:predicted dehydrogenase